MQLDQGVCRRPKLGPWGNLIGTAWHAGHPRSFSTSYQWPMKRLCIKPVQDDALRIGINDERKFVGLRLEVLEIVCTTNLQATIGNILGVHVLRVECSSLCIFLGYDGFGTSRKCGLRAPAATNSKKTCSANLPSVKVNINLSSSVQFVWLISRTFSANE